MNPEGEVWLGALRLGELESGRRRHTQLFCLQRDGAWEGVVGRPALFGVGWGVARRPAARRQREAAPGSDTRRGARRPDMW